MDLLKNYADSDMEDDNGDEQFRPIDFETITALALPQLNMAPSVIGNEISIQKVALVDPKTKELTRNPKYEELFLPVVRIFHIIIQIFTKYI